MTTNNLVELQNVEKVFRIGGLIAGTRLRALSNINLSMTADQPSILSVVGESGSGKSTLARLILKIIEPSQGKVFVDGHDLFGKKDISDDAFRHLVQPIFQNPFETFSARKPVDSYLYETALNLHCADDRAGAKAVISQALESVGLKADYVSGKFLAQFSGGELQRISIARALIARPKLIVADEPVSMIDASMKMNVVNLFLQLKEQYQISFLYITHDLSTAYYVSDRVAIMYRGNIVEYGASNAILTEPLHPYTELLMEAVPRVGVKWSEDLKMPDLETKEYGVRACKFAARCPFARDICRQQEPPLIRRADGRTVLCFKYSDYQPVKEVNG
jgi:peptide/nickel transport system ATP-binding protein